jgi:hypothetical protein
MNPIIIRDSDNLKMQAERIKENLTTLEQDCSAWDRKREQKDLRNLMEDLKKTYAGVNLMLTDCLRARSQCGEEAARLVFDDLCEILCCLDPLFSVLKKARMQLEEDYIHPAILARFEIDYSRFRKLIGNVQMRVNRQQPRNNVPSEDASRRLAREYAATV